MATRFEVVLHGNNPVSLRASGEEALEEIRTLESRLSLFLPSSEISRVNALAARQPVKLSPPVFRLLESAQQLWRDTHGAFDVTIAPLLRAWGFLGGKGSWPAEEAIAEAKTRTGMHLVHLNAHEFTVSFEREGVMLDLGAIGKGYAIDAAVEILRETGVTAALIHGGTSTAYGLGTPPDALSWKIAIEPPPSNRTGSGAGDSPNKEEFPPGPKEGLAVVSLRDEALSVSALSGKCFEHAGKTYGHVLDPRTGYPADAAVVAAVVLPSATEADALSTAMLVGGAAQFQALSEIRSNMRSLLASTHAGELRIQASKLPV